MIYNMIFVINKRTMLLSNRQAINSFPPLKSITGHKFKYFDTPSLPFPLNDVDKIESDGGRFYMHRQRVGTNRFVDTCIQKNKNLFDCRGFCQRRTPIRIERQTVFTTKTLVSINPERVHRYTRWCFKNPTSVSIRRSFAV